jgi:methionyl-tRNA formyltransferase
LIKFSMLLVNNNRSKAYLQNLIQNGFIPTKIIVLDGMNQTLVEHTENDKIISKDTQQKFIRSLNDLNISFDEKEHIQKTIVKNNLDYSVVDTLEVNSPTVINAVKELVDEYIVYSGPGGTILKKEMFSLNKKFIHVHPGLLPGFRGSTTIYYSMLFESKVGCSVMLFDERIDEGPILFKAKYQITEAGIDFDYVLDPLVRAKTLISFFQTNKLTEMAQNQSEEAATFYIIHPLLKHLSILKHNEGSLR